MEHSNPHATIKFSIKDVSHIVCMDDFYRATHMMNLLREGLIVDVQQVWMNNKQVIELENICLANMKQDERFDGYADRSKELAVSMDWLNYAPVSVPYIPEDEIWIWAKEYYHAAMDEYRAWHKNNNIKEI